MLKLTHQWVAAVIQGAARPKGSNLGFTVLPKVTCQHSTADPSIIGIPFYQLNHSWPNLNLVFKFTLVITAVSDEDSDVGM